VAGERALRPGQRLLDIGCGWGGLVLHAVKHYGVKAVGITLSRRQWELANERIRQAGLGADGRVELLDYRDIDRSLEFDKLVSVGMFEHVGYKNYREYMEVVDRCLKPGGFFLLHTIAENVTDFQLRYFLNNVAQPVTQLITAQQQTAVRQVEVSVSVRTAHPVVNGQRSTVSATTSTSVRNLQFREAL